MIISWPTVKRRGLWREHIKIDKYSIKPSSWSQSLLFLWVASLFFPQMARVQPYHYISIHTENLLSCWCRYANKTRWLTEKVQRGEYYVVVEFIGSFFLVAHWDWLLLFTKYFRYFLRIDELKRKTCPESQRSLCS